MDLLDRMLGHDSWTTCQLLSIASALPEETLQREFDIGHRSVLKTFEHMVWNVECWTDLMQSVTVRKRVASYTIRELNIRYQQASEQLLELARELREAGRLNDSYTDHLDDPPVRKSFAGTLLHLATHGMHHRAQLLYLLRMLGVTDLPEGDALSWESQNHTPESSPYDTGTIDERPSEGEIEFVDQQLKEFNRVAAGDDFKPLNLVVRNEDGQVIAGLNALTGWQWLYVQILWVEPTSRSTGLGSQLLSRAEEIAQSRGCHGSCLSSFSFQAPDFYLKQGYTKFGTIEDYPHQHSMHFFSKRLTQV